MKGRRCPIDILPQAPAWLATVEPPKTDVKKECGFPQKWYPAPCQNFAALSCCHTSILSLLHQLPLPVESKHPQMHNGWQRTLKRNDPHIPLEVLIWHGDTGHIFLPNNQSLNYQHNKVNQTIIFPCLTIFIEKYLFLDKQMNNEPIQYSPTADKLGTVNQSPVPVSASQRGPSCLLSIQSHSGLSPAMVSGSPLYARIYKNTILQSLSWNPWCSNLKFL